MDGVKGDNMNFNPADIFQQFFGGGMGGMGDGFPFSNLFGGGSSSRRSRGPEDVVIKHQVSLEDIYLGKDIEVTYNQISQCKACNGTGSKVVNQLNVHNVMEEVCKHLCIR